MTTEPLTEIEFRPWPKISRLFREVLVSEKIDGSNAAVGILEDGTVYAQSRKRLITIEDDNFGFAAWVHDNQEDLRTQLGPGLHFGEWWGKGIQRNYGLDHRRFSLFNAIRWESDPDGGYRCIEAPVCHVVPIISRSDGFGFVNQAVHFLRENGSIAAPGFMNPEGVVAYHKASNQSFKVKLEKDEEWKGKKG